MHYINEESRGERMKKYDTVLFDFDGTLMNTNDVIIASWQHTYEVMTGKMGDEAEIIKTFGEKLEETMSRCFGEERKAEALDTYRNYQKGFFLDKISLFDGMKELIAILHEKGYKLAIVTSRMSESLFAGLRKYDLEKYFGAVVTCDDTSEHKPSPAPVLLALKKLGSNAERSLMLGDSNYDVLCAKNAGVKSVMVGWALDGCGENLKTLDDCTPDYTIEKATDLLYILE